MILGKYAKVPLDRKRYKIDYSDWLDTGEFVISATFQVTLQAGAVSTDMSIDGIAIDPTFKMVYFFANAGLAGVTYKILVTMTTTGAQVREDSIFFVVNKI